MSEHDTPAPADPRFRLGTRVRIMATPAGAESTLGWIGTVERISEPSADGRGLLVDFGWPRGFWTYAAAQLVLVEDDDASCEARQLGGLM